MTIKTDSKTEIGITVGLIDSLITICQILRQKEKYWKSKEAIEAIKDFYKDSDVKHLFVTGIRHDPKSLKTISKALKT